jgi:hypothetical protein
MLCLVMNLLSQHEWFQANWLKVAFTTAHTDQCAVYPQHWIRYRGSISWPTESLEHTPTDFYLWGHVKDYGVCQ